MSKKLLKSTKVCDTFKKQVLLLSGTGLLQVTITTGKQQKRGELLSKIFSSPHHD